MGFRHPVHAICASDCFCCSVIGRSLQKKELHPFLGWGGCVEEIESEKSWEVMPCCRNGQLLIDTEEPLKIHPMVCHGVDLKAPPHFNIDSELNH